MSGQIFSINAETSWRNGPHSYLVKLIIDAPYAGANPAPATTVTCTLLELSRGCLFFGAMPRLRRIIKSRIKDPLGLTFGVVILIIADRPDKSGKPDQAQQKGQGYKCQKNRHLPDSPGVFRSSNAPSEPSPGLTAFSTTVIDDADMAMAARRGVASPAKASGRAIRL